MKKTIKNIIKKAPGFDNLNLLRFRINYFLKDDETVIKEKYRAIFGKELNLENPKTFNEKIQWRILKDRKDIYTQLADKYLVRDYVKGKIGEEYLIKLLGVYEKAEDIDYDKLPNKFVLKCNHDSGSVIICKDKSTFNKKEANKKLNFSLKRNFYYITREWHYKNIKPLIICEEFLEENGKAPKDYKFHIFNNSKGSNIFIQCDVDRFDGHKRAMLDEKWKLTSFEYKKKTPNIIPEKPLKFDEMKKLALKLSKDFEMSRIDFYEVNEKIYFGEITFTSEAGTGIFYPDEWDYKLGEMWEIR
ncbi:ATP-grasp fold amidoligase family protein (plasmid) [Cetobacterium somerae]|uniref:ATP-grasp fold amidoligase family protein n=1 Tax=Cetobacterium somerae TaxID=188913 RepID=UPI003D766704